MATLLYLLGYLVMLGGVWLLAQQFGLSTPWVTAIIVILAGLGIMATSDRVRKRD